MKRAILLILLGLLIPAAVPTASAQESAIRLADPPATLKVFNQEIVEFRASHLHSTPERRLETAQRRLGRIRGFALYDEVEVRETEIDGHPVKAFYSGENYLFMLVPQDVDPEERISVHELAERVEERVNKVRLAVKDQRNPRIIARGVALCLLATLVFVGLIWVLRKIREFFRRRLVKHAAGLTWMKVRNFDIRRFVLPGIRKVVGFLFFIAVFFTAYTYVGFILNQFPYTQPWGEVLGERLADLVEGVFRGIIEAVPGIVTVIVIFALTRWAAQLVSGLFKSIEGDSKKRSEDDEGALVTGDTARATRRIAVVTVWIAGVVIAYPYIPGSDSDAFKGISVLIGLMVSLGSTGVVSQFMSGFVVLYSGAIRTGEYARIGDTEGKITEINLLSTKVLTPKNEYVTVPNSVLLGKNTINYSRLQASDVRTELHTKVTIGYDTPWRQVEALLLQAADRTPGIRKQPAPRVLQTALNDWYVEYELRFIPGDISKKAPAMSMVHQRILDTFNEYGVQIMSPHFVAQPDGSVLVKPEDQAPPPSDQRLVKKAQKKVKDPKADPRNC